MAIKKISELERLTPQNVSGDDAIIINDGDTTKQITVENLLQGTSNIDAVFSNTVINGNLTINGTETIVERETITVDNNVIVLNSGFTGNNPTIPAGLVVNRDEAGDKILEWDENEDIWSVGEETFAAGALETVNLSAENVTINGGFINGVDIGLEAQGDIVGELIQANTQFRGDISGSVLAQDSSILVDSETGLITGNLTGNWVSQESNFEINAAGIDVIFGEGLFLSTDGSADLSAEQNFNINADTLNFSSVTNTTFNGGFTVNDGLINAALNGDVTGSVFGQDSSLLVDAVNNTLVLESNSTLDLKEDPAATMDSGTMYFTSARARQAVGAADNGGDGSFSYNSETGVFEYTGPNASEVRSHFSEGVGVDIDTASGEISIGQSVNTTDDVEFASVTSDFTGIFRAADSSILVDSESGTLSGTLNGNLIGTVSGVLDGEVKGSVFGDDSALLVDGINGEIVAPIRDLQVNGETGNVPSDTTIVDSWLEIEVNGATKYFPLYT
jgi:hypothetical protein